MARYPWSEIKAKYETGKYSVKELSTEYGFNYKYGCRKAKKEGWEKGKSREKVEWETTKKIVEEEVEKEVDLRREYAKIIKNIRIGLANELFTTGKPDFNKLKCFKIATETIKNCRSEDWEIYEIEEVAKKVKQQLDGNIGHELDYSYLSDEELNKELRKYEGDE